jgi:hypothetical protein
MSNTIQRWNEHANREAERFGKNSDDDWGPKFIERVLAEHVLALIEIYEIQNKTLNKISRIVDEVSSEYAESALTEVQKILEEK